MAVYVAVDESGEEWCFDEIPERELDDNTWQPPMYSDNSIQLPKGSIEKLIGRPLTWGG